MKRYFFNLSDGTFEPDQEGTELPDDQHAQQQAIRFAGDVLRHEPHRLGDGHLRIDVSVANESVLFAIDISLERNAEA